MKVVTPILFQLLLRYERPDLVFDIGSMDGSEALRFRKDLPNTRIIAFEANPNNVDIMFKNNTLKENRIEVQNKAVWNKNGTINKVLKSLSPKIIFIDAVKTSTMYRINGTIYHTGL